MFAYMINYQMLMYHRDACLFLQQSCYLYHLIAKPFELGLNKQHSQL